MYEFERYVLPLTIVVASILVLKIMSYFVTRLLSKSENIYAKYVLDLKGVALPMLYLGVFYVAFHMLTVNPAVTIFFNYAFSIAFVFLLTRLVTGAFARAIRSYLTRQDETGTKLRQVRGIILIANAVLWIVAVIFLFDNLGFNVTAILTGLGVGGIAIALAAQAILGDLFNYFVIFFDQPFELGDFVIVDDKMGTVEYIGLKTTRIRSLQGEQIVFSNTNLTSSRIHNYKRMQERRILFKFGVVYDTSLENLELIPALSRGIIEQQEQTRFDRAHFASFGDYSLNFEVVYHILSSDYNRYMDIQQRINLQIVKMFKVNGIDFAFPTYSVDFRDSLEKMSPDVRHADFGKINGRHS